MSLTAVGLVCGGLIGCASDALELAPSSPEKPWTVDASQFSADDGGNENDAHQSALSRLQAPPALKAGHTYKLPELIDLAQRNNLATRSAWEMARQAALSVGIAEATYLPFISANVIAGSHQTEAPLPVPIGADHNFTTSVSGVVPFVALQWLVFDFGGRSALVSSAKQLTLAANLQFNAAHQKLIFDVTRTFYEYNAARMHHGVAVQSLTNSRKILNAAEDKRKNGLATTVEVAQARQLVAQAELRKVQSAGEEQNAYQTLLAAIGISPTSRLKIAKTSNRNLPNPANASVQSMIDLALSQRPDVLASYSALKASEFDIEGAEAQFMPKVSVYGGLSTYNGDFEVNGLPTIGQRGTTADIFVGVSIPIYDSGLREAQLKAARSRHQVAKNNFNKTKDEAAREIVFAVNTLKSSIQASKAAKKLVETASITYDFTLDAYRNGVGTITAAITAETGLMDARLAYADAHAGALAAAANLAFILGALTSNEPAQDVLNRLPVR